VPTQLSQADFAGLTAIAQARRQLLVQTFNGTRLKFGNSDRIEVTAKIAKNSKKIVSNSKKIAEEAYKGSKTVLEHADTIRTAAVQFIGDCADIDNIDDVIDTLTSDVFKELVGEIMPFVSMALSAKKLYTASKAIVADGKAIYNYEKYSDGFLPGDPLAAAEAVKGMIERDLARKSIDFARASTSLGLKIAGMFGDGGTATTVAIGLANSIAGLGLELYALGCDIKEMRAGNRRLATPQTLDITVFTECPLLGCYMLVCADTSSIANFFIVDIGLPGWMDKVEEIKKKKIDPLLKMANKNIEKSHLQLDGLSQNKAVHDSKTFFSTGKKVASAMVNS
jgi:hypothetical protein